MIHYEKRSVKKVCNPWQQSWVGREKGSTFLNDSDRLLRSSEQDLLVIYYDNSDGFDTEQRRDKSRYS